MSHLIGNVLLHLTRSSTVKSRSVRSVSAATVSVLASIIKRNGLCSTSAGAEIWTQRAAELGGFQGKVRALSSRASDAVTSGSRGVEHVLVPCASAGHIVVSLYNVRKHPPTAPLLLYLPPSSAVPLESEENSRRSTEGQTSIQPSEDVVMNLRPPPDYLLRQNFPIAVIRYRWTPGREDEDIKRDWQVDQDPSQRQEAQSSHLWPRPLHDVTFAYGWIKRHLSPSLSDSTRSVDGRGHFLHRDIYVYGAYLGASLATSLALTETHPSQRVAIRGVATYNGIYNWTAFVGVKDDCIPIVVDVKTVQKDTPGIQALPLLFRQPSDLFDDFASPCLFFRTTGHLVAPLDLDPNISQRLLEENEARLEEEEERENRKTSQAFGKRTFSIESLGTSRKVYLGFPPVRSTLCLPSALLLHTSAPPDVSTKPTRERKRGVTSIPRRKIPESSNGKNSFAIQAEEMTALMRRSIDLIEVKRVKDQQPALMPENVDHRTGDYDAAILSNKSKRRVRIVGVDGPRDGSLELGIDGQKKLLAWLREHMLQNQE